MQPPSLCSPSPRPHSQGNKHTQRRYLCICTNVYNYLFVFVSTDIHRLKPYEIIKIHECICIYEYEFIYVYIFICLDIIMDYTYEQANTRTGSYVRTSYLIFDVSYCVNTSHSGLI
jgi:hypothetical protein